ncbi:MAG: hypothetical protein KF757_02655 [Phycisphaeraceae bacterium]|nr:hypothetical protein [Phycisphaeraceae bacterium]MCW5762112.1 hypothetical protein [Phycisphaeraceae bacterium]
MSIPPHMSPDEFRRLGHFLIDWIADYHAGLEGRAVQSFGPPGTVLAAMPQRLAEEAGTGDTWKEMLAFVDGTVTSNLLHWQSPRFFGYFPCNASFPGILGEILAAGLNVNGMLWATSPAATEVEMRCTDWMADLIGLPGEFTFENPGANGQGGGCIAGTASESTLVSLLAARGRLRERGSDVHAMTVYASRHAHSSIVKAAMIAGLADGPEDRRRVRLIECDDVHRMDADALGRAIRADVAAGLVPGWVCATIGMTSSESVDSLVEIRRVVPEEVWLHADAAFTGAALVCEEHRWMIEGVERADSVCFNPHKWLLTNFDCDCFWTRDRASLVRALSVLPEYLRNSATEAGAVVDYRDWQIPLGRRFRALKLMFVLRHYGREGLRAHVRAHIAAAAWLEQQVHASEYFEMASPRVTSLVCLCCAEGDDATRRVMEAINSSGRAFVSHTMLPDESGRERFVMRVAIGGTATRLEHVKELWALMCECAR